MLSNVVYASLAMMASVSVQGRTCLTYNEAMVKSDRVPVFATVDPICSTTAMRNHLGTPCVQKCAQDFGCFNRYDPRPAPSKCSVCVCLHCSTFIVSGEWFVIDLVPCVTQTQSMSVVVPLLSASRGYLTTRTLPRPT